MGGWKNTELWVGWIGDAECGEVWRLWEWQGYAWSRTWRGSVPAGPAEEPPPSPSAASADSPHTVVAADMPHTEMAEEEEEKEWE